ncbi:hypothetical protein GF337_13300 [candidate division KSB1 bacterium]|nr:hypothetical protein [candidate division KSB1 bacterium]
MLHKDYIMRMIEQFSNVLAQIIFNRQIKKYDLAETEIQKAYKDLLGSDREFILSLSDDAILRLFKSSSETGYERCIFIAELMKEEAQIIESKDGSEAYAMDLYFKAFRVLGQVIIESKYWRQEPYLNSLEFLVNKISRAELPDSILIKLFQYYDIIDSYAEAENILFDLIDNNYPNILEEGEQFYQRLLKLSDDALTAGNLPREEVNDGLKEIRIKSADNT